jgi:hypothetical protein
MQSVKFAELQLELFGKKALLKLAHLVSSHDLEELTSTYRSMRDVEVNQTMEHTFSGEEDQGDDNAFVSSLMELKNHPVSRYTGFWF